MLPNFSHRPTPPRLWSPMTDREWHALSYIFHSTETRGRPPRDRRAVWDGIFWVACGNEPWGALPKTVVNHATCNGTLIDYARKGVLDLMLIAVCPRHPFHQEDLLSLEWPVVRAFRRASRQLPVSSLIFARNLGMISALPCHPSELPTEDFDGPMQADSVPKVPRISKRLLRDAPLTRIVGKKPPQLPLKRPRRLQLGARPRAFTGAAPTPKPPPKP